MIAARAMATVKKSKLLDVLSLVNVNPLTAGPEFLGNSLDCGAGVQSQLSTLWSEPRRSPAETRCDCLRGERTPSKRT